MKGQVCLGMHRLEIELERTLVALPLFIGEESQGRQRWRLPGGLSKARTLSSWGLSFQNNLLVKK